MKNFKSIITLFIAIAFLSSCSSDDNSGGNNPVGGDHTYDISITSGILSGTELEGTVANEDFSGMYFDYQGTKVLNISLGSVASGFNAGGAVVLMNGQSTSQLNDEYDVDSGGSTLIFTFKKDGQDYSFSSISGSCSVSNLQTYGVQGVGVGGASYKLNFSGSFKQANYDGLDEDAPIVQMNGILDIKRLIID